MGRIHQIGQKHFNFVAANTVEGRVLEKLLQSWTKFAGMGDRVFDVSQLLQLNDIRFEK